MLVVESVAWVSERKDVLSTFFGMLMIAAYYRYVKISGLKNYLLIIILLSLGLMAKPMLVTFPFVLLLLDFWPLKRFQLINKNSQQDESQGFVHRHYFRLILEKVPLFIPVVISSILTFSAQKGEGALVPLEALSIKTRFANALISYVSYVLKAIWPRNLAVYYPHPVGNLPVWQICGAALLIAGVFFGLSIVIDMFQDKSILNHMNGIRIFLEDGFKFFGIISWLTFFTRLCVHSVNEAIVLKR